LFKKKQFGYKPSMSCRKKGVKMDANLVPVALIESKIYCIRNQKVMLDRDLADLYSVQTKALKQAVKRNSSRFPEDFMFVLSPAELADWRSQFVTSKADKKGLRYAPMAFTEQGVAMLSTVLSSERAVEVNIQIMRTFVRMRQMLLVSKELREELDELKRQTTCWPLKKKPNAKSALLPEKNTRHMR
jgi:hypothetical protein